MGILLVDIVTERRASPHADLLRALGRIEEEGLAPALYAAAYRPVDPESDPKLEVWIEELRIGTSLPVLPLWLRTGPCLGVDLEASYEDACRDLLIPPAP